MPKKKKTRQQKIVADKRRESNFSSLYSLSLERLKDQAKQQVFPIQQTTIAATPSYNYLLKDLRKTALFMGFIMLIEIMLKIFTK